MSRRCRAGDHRWQMSAASFPTGASEREPSQCQRADLCRACAFHHCRPVAAHAAPVLLGVEVSSLLVGSVLSLCILAAPHAGLPLSPRHPAGLPILWRSLPESLRAMLCPTVFMRLGPSPWPRGPGALGPPLGAAGPVRAASSALPASRDPGWERQEVAPLRTLGLRCCKCQLSGWPRPHGAASPACVGALSHAVCCGIVSASACLGIRPLDKQEGGAARPEQTARSHGAAAHFNLRQEWESGNPGS